MRVIVVSTDPGSDTSELAPRLDAEIRVGGDAGASEVIVLRAWGDAARDEESLVMGLLLPDAPVVTWWPGAAPEVPGTSPLGRIAQRRITDASTQADPQAALQALATSYMPGDADFAWTRLTLWRAQLAAVLDQPPYEPVTGVAGHRGHRLAVDDAARGVAPHAARRAVCVQAHEHRGGIARHPRGAPRARERHDRARARRARRGDASPAEPAHARCRAPPSNPPRLPRRRASAPRPR